MIQSSNICNFVIYISMKNNNFLKRKETKFSFACKLMGQ